MAESTVREYVRGRKRAMGLAQREVFVPQSYGPGQEAQVDWFEAQVKLDGEARELQFFAMRSMNSGGAFHPLIQTPRNKLFWKRMSMPSPISAESFEHSAMTTWLLL